MTVEDPATTFRGNPPCEGVRDPLMEYDASLERLKLALEAVLQARRDLEEADGPLDSFSRLEEGSWVSGPDPRELQLLADKIGAHLDDVQNDPLCEVDGDELLNLANALRYREEVIPALWNFARWADGDVPNPFEYLDEETIHWLADVDLHVQEPDPDVFIVRTSELEELRRQAKSIEKAER